MPSWIDAILSSMTDPKYQEGSELGAVINPQQGSSPLGQAMQQATYSPPMSFGYPGQQAPTIPQGDPSGASQSPYQVTPVPNPQGTSSPLPDASPVAQATQAQDQGTDPSAQALSQLPPSAIQQLLTKQATDPNYAFNNALIAAGAGILGGKNLADGLSQGVSAFGGTLNSTLNQQREQNTPKVVPLADGAFTMVQLPGGQPQVMANKDVAGFLMGQKVLQGNIGLQKVILQNQLKQTGQQQQQTRQQGYEANTSLVQARNTLQAMDDALKVVGSDDDSWSRQAAANWPTLSGALPGTADLSAKNAILARVKVDQELLQGAVQKGAVTKSQAETYASDVPKVTDSNAKWREWITRNRPLMANIEARSQELVNAGANAGAPGLQAQVAAPGNGGAKINSKADYDALPSGAFYTAPDGSMRRKQ
jgi:hypothetical protein